MRLSFSGHETFPCRQFWLKKGYDFYKHHEDFTDRVAVTEMGVGRNMVRSIRYWMRSFGLLDDDGNVTSLADYLLADDGQDPYLEDVGTLWLLHYMLVKTEQASIYSLVFNELRKERIEFTQDQIVNFLDKKCKAAERKISDNSLRQDTRVFINSYVRPRGKSGNVEDMFSALMIDLDLVHEVGRSDSGKEVYKLEGRKRPEIPNAIILYAILNEKQGNSINAKSLMVDRHNVGPVFVLTDDGLAEKLQEISSEFSDATYTEDAGIRELQFVERPEPQAILDAYYAA